MLCEYDAVIQTKVAGHVWSTTDVVRFGVQWVDEGNGIVTVTQ
jgi:hypothetical protein